LADSFSQADLLYLNNIKLDKNIRLRVLGLGSLSGVDIDSINNLSIQNDINNIRLKYNINYDSFIFCFMARKTKVKGAIDILRAFQIVNSNTTNVKLLYIGPDEDGIIQKLKIVSSSLFKNVIDISEVSNIYSFLSISNVLCVPSMMEGFGTVVLDAGAVGRPAIGYRVTGLVDSISHNNTGLLSEPGDLKIFAENMILLRNNIEVTKLLGNNARERVNSFFNSNFVSTNLSKFYLEYLH
jgi:glycosyltransferase involved in cell wall biosynthesis